MSATPDDHTSWPLAGIKIVELHAIGPVPFAGQLLRSLGADVQRVSPPADPGLGISTNPRFDVSNAGKRPVTIDLKSAKGLAQARNTPVPPLNVVGDYGGGAIHLAVGVLAQLVRRGIDGRGGVAVREPGRVVASRPTAANADARR